LALIKIALRYDPLNADLAQLTSQINVLQRLDPLCLLEKAGPVVLCFSSRIKARQHLELIKDIEHMVSVQKPNELLRKYNDLIYQLLRSTAKVIVENPSDLETVYKLLDVILGTCAEYNLLTGKFHSN
jgi:hypothetical protein